jgi:predicted GIY-YIG superfamily endonuclease
MAKKFKVHKMYKGKTAKTAKTMAQHNTLKKQGYTHTKPKKKK